MVPTIASTLYPKAATRTDFSSRWRGYAGTISIEAKCSGDSFIVRDRSESVMMVATQGEAAAACAGRGDAAVLGVADWLCLAAAPTFAIMALLTGVFGARDILCSAGRGALSLSGMVPMYLLMSAVHAAPWLKLIAGRRRGFPAGPNPGVVRSSGVEPSSPLFRCHFATKGAAVRPGVRRR
jgi:hypothetical protein